MMRLKKKLFYKSRVWWSLIRYLIWLVFIAGSLLNVFQKIPGVNVNLSFSDIMYVIAFFLIFIEQASKGKEIFYIINSKYKIALVSIYLIGLGTFLSLFRSQDTVNSLSTFIQYVFILIVLLTVIDYLIDGKVENGVKVIKVWLLPYIITSVLVCASSFNLINIFDETIKSLNGRYQGFYGLSTALGINMTISTVMLIFIFLNSKYKIAWFLMILASLYTIILSGSFGSIFTMAGILLMMGYFSGKRKIIIRFSIIITSIIILLIVSLYGIDGVSNYITFAPDIIKERLERSDGEIGSFSVRMELNFLGLESFVNNFFVGTGFDQFKYHNYHQANIHNTIIAAAAETGIFGLLGVLVFLLVPINYCFKLLKSKVLENELSYSLVKFLLIYAGVRLAQTMISGPFVRREQWVPILIIIALYVAFLRLSPYRSLTTLRVKTFISKSLFKRQDQFNAEG